MNEKKVRKAFCDGILELTKIAHDPKPIHDALRRNSIGNESIGDMFQRIPLRNVLDIWNITKSLKFKSNPSEIVRRMNDEVAKAKQEDEE